MDLVKLIICTFFSILLTIQKCYSEGDSDKYHIVTQPMEYEETLYFELLIPQEISYTYRIRPAKDFGVILNQTLLEARLVPAEPIDGCSPLANDLYISDAVAFIERGHCSFLTKTLNAEAAGAHAAIIYDHDKTNDGHMVDMIQDDTERSTKIAAFFLLGKDGHMIRQSLESQHLMNAVINIPINVTGIPSTLINQPPWTLW